MDLTEVADHTEASQNVTEFKFLLHEVAVVSPKVILEIGTWKGYSLESFYKAFKPEMIITIEGDKPTIAMLNLRIERGDFNYMDPSPILVEGLSQHPKTFEAVKRELGGRMVDFLFIDGGHKYHEVKADFENYSQLVRKGGIIGLHDVCLTGNPEVEVSKFWGQIMKRYNKSACYICARNGTGTGIIHWG